MEETGLRTSPNPGSRVRYSSEDPPRSHLNRHGPILAFGAMATSRAAQENRSDSFPGFTSLVA